MREKGLVELHLGLRHKKLKLSLQVAVEYCSNVFAAKCNERMEEEEIEEAED